MTADNPDRSLVLAIYDTIADPGRWQDVLDRIAENVGGRGCIVFEWDMSAGARRLVAPLHSSGYQTALIDAYLEAFRVEEGADQDAFEAISLKADGIDLIDDSAIHPDEAAFLRRPNVRQLVEYDLRHRSAGLLDKDNTARSRFSVQHGDAHGPMRPEERARLSGVLPHVAKALDLGRPAAAAAAERLSLLTAMDSLRIGVCILDGAGRVAVANSEFERQREALGAWRIDRDGRLRLHDGADQRRFEALKADALNHGRFGARPRKEAVAMRQESEGDQGVAALSIEVAPLTRADALAGGLFGGSILFSVDTARPPPLDPAALRPVFGLTRAEAALAALLGEGLTNAEIAERRGRSLATVNAQVRTLLSKTGTANRTQFVRLMMGFGAVFFGPEG